MFKKAISILGLGLLISSTTSAQFIMSPVNDTIILNTTGQGSYNPAQGSFSGTIDPAFHINNTAANSLTFKWTLLSDSTEHPQGWVLAGICDNVTCRTPYSDFYNHVEQTTMTIAPGETDANKTLIEARIYAPVTSANGTGVFRIKLTGYNTSDLSTPLKTDTLVIILHKNGTSISNIPTDDKRVALYPNPAMDNLTVFADKTLNPSNISIVNINGAEVLSTVVEKSNESTHVNINTLAAGTYMVRVNDTNGSVITTRKFVKK